MKIGGTEVPLLLCNEPDFPKVQFQSAKCNVHAQKMGPLTNHLRNTYRFI